MQDAPTLRVYIPERKGLKWSNTTWLNNHFVTLAYYSLVDIENTHPAIGEFDEAIGWFDFKELPAMWIDHKAIVLKAKERLKEDIKQEQVTYNLPPHKFTMPELHQLHQTILEEKIDRSRF